MAEPKAREPSKIKSPSSPAHDGPETVEIEFITPELASAYMALGEGRNNRPVNRAVVARYKRELLAGRWRLTGDPIRFDVDGKLIDGQHRLTACIAANIPFRSLVARGLQSDVINVLDSGRVRKAHDVLAIHGYSNAYMLASAARWLLMMRNGLTLDGDGEVANRPSNEEILHVVQKHPKLADSCNICARPKGILPSLLAAIHYVGKEILDKKAEDGSHYADHFVDVFVKGKPYYEEGDPALKLREMVMADNLRGVKPTVRTYYTNSIYVWNAFADERSIPVFRPPEVTAIRGLKTDSI